MADSEINSTWMGNLPPNLRSQPLKNIAIPGSHNTFSYSINSDSTVSPCSPDIIRKLVSVLGKTLCKVIHSWCVTQTMTVTEQLQRGTRYLDLRVATKKSEDGLFFVHGLYGCSLEIGLKEISQWLDSHETEVVLLDFNHLYDMDFKDHKLLVTLLKRIFGKRLCPVIDTENLSLDLLLENQWNAIAFYHNDYQEKVPTLWPGWCIPSPWPHTFDLNKMVNFLEANYTVGRNTSLFHVTQGILTPSSTTILQHITRSLKSIVAVPAIKSLKCYLKDKKSGPSGVNVVIADFVESENFINSVLALNKVVHSPH